MSNLRTIRAGDYRQRVTVNAITRGTATATGEKPPVETAVATVWAKVETLTGRMGELARSVYPTATDRIEMRYMAGLTVTRSSITFGARRFAINGINDV